MKNKQQDFWNSMSGRYDGFIRKYANNTYQQVFHLIGKELYQEAHVLEIGTGTGIISFAIRQHVKSIHAIDYAKDMIDIARKKQKELKVENIEFETGEANKLKFKDDLFDIVIASNLFHLLEDPDLAIKEVKRVLNDGGKFIVPTYCHGDGIKSRLISFFIRLSGFKAPNKWSVPGLNMFIENAGFSIKTQFVIKDKIPLNFIVAEK